MHILSCMHLVQTNRENEYMNIILVVCTSCTHLLPCVCNWSIVWFGSSVVECSHGKRETLGSSPGLATFFFCSCDIWWPVWVRARAARDCLVSSGMVPSRFGDESN